MNAVDTTDAPPLIPDDDPRRNAAIVTVDSNDLAHISLAGDTYTILLRGDDTSPTLGGGHPPSGWPRPGPGRRNTSPSSSHPTDQGARARTKASERICLQTGYVIQHGGWSGERRRRPGRRLRDLPDSILIPLDPSVQPA
jgi:hypothetical protein